MERSRFFSAMPDPSSRSIAGTWHPGPGIRRRLLPRGCLRVRMVSARSARANCTLKSAGRERPMRRRDVLAGAGSFAAGATAGFPAPAVAQGIRQLSMATDWPETMPGLYSSARRLAQTIGEATGGRIKIEVFPAGGFVRAFETFDAVSAGVADMYHAFEGYFRKKSPALHFFSAMAFGFTANELFAWVRYGGGQELWDALSGQFNVKALLACSTGCQMGGWFTREVTSPDGFKGLRYRMAGPGAEVLRRLGAIVVTLPVSEIMPALRSGAIDASEWGRPVARRRARAQQSGGVLLFSRLPRAGQRPGGRDQQKRVGKLRRARAPNHRGRGGRRICEFSGTVQRQQRAVAAQAAR